MSDAIFALLLEFALIWTLIGIGGVMLLTRSQNQSLRSNTDALLVFLPILLVFAMVSD